MNKDIRKKLIIIASTFLIFIIIYVLYNNYIDKYNDYYGGVNVSYKDGKKIKINNFNNDFTIEKTIVIENKSNKSYTYSLEWQDVSNQLKEQNKFLYTITGEGDRTAELLLSQVPVADAIVFPQALIEGNTKQTYTIKFRYKGNEKNASFDGILKVKAKAVDDNSSIEHVDIKERLKKRKESSQESNDNMKKANE